MSSQIPSNRSLEELIHLYLNNLQVRNYSKRTVKDYGYNLGFLERFLKEKNIHSIQEITASIVAEFQQWFFYLPTKRGHARSAKDQNTVLTTVKGFFKFLKHEEFLSHDPAANVEYAREPRRLPKNILTPQEAKRIIESVDISNARGYRDRVLLEVLYSCGARRTELLNVKVQDVNLEEELLFIREGKGGADRIVPLSHIACKMLETYIKGVRPQLLFGRNSDFLFLSRRGKQLDRESLSTIIKKYAKLAKIQKNVTPHLWRHSMACHLLKNDSKLRHLQSILGHKSLATTEKYLHLTINEIKDEHRKHHPRENDC